MTETDEARELATLRETVALQSKVCRQNVDRTLATWTRTALSLIVFGAVVDRYSVLLLRNHPPHVYTWLAPNPMSSLGGVILVSLGIFVAVSAAVRHQAYCVVWKRVYGRDEYFGPWLAFGFAVLVAIFGIALLVMLLVLVK